MKFIINILFNFLMGYLISKILQLFQWNKRNFKLIILGLHNAGKTTILYRLSLGQLVTTHPTIGSNVEDISHNNLIFQAWDLGGQKYLRNVWDDYLTNTHGIIFVVDSSDFENYKESKNEFHKLLQNEDLKYNAILIYANKQDIDNAKSVSELIKMYEFDKIKDHLWYIQGCSAKTGQGLLEGLEWLSNQIYKKSTRFPKNPYLVDSKYLIV
jgi:small GTP-binding protein